MTIYFTHFGISADIRTVAGDPVRKSMVNIEIWSGNSSNTKAATKDLHWYQHSLCWRSYLGKIEVSSSNELWLNIEPYLTPCTSSVLGLLIFKCTVSAVEPKRCYWINSSLYTTMQSFSDGASCTTLYKGEQKDRTKTLAEFPDHWMTMGSRFFSAAYILYNKDIKFQSVFEDWRDIDRHCS